MTTTPLTDVTFGERVLQARGAVLVEFWKEGCGPCEAFKPVVEQLAAERPDITVATYEVVLGSPRHRRWKRYGIEVTPTLVLFRDGEVAWKSGGMRGIEQLRAEVDAALDAPPERGVA